MPGSAWGWSTGRWGLEGSDHRPGGSLLAHGFQDQVEATAWAARDVSKPAEGPAPAAIARK